MSERTGKPRTRPPLTAAQRYYSDFMMDVFVYTVVLNLFVEYDDAIVIDSFTVSLLTAIVMKGMIDLINHLVARVKAYFGPKEGTAAKVLMGLSAWAIMWDCIFTTATSTSKACLPVSKFGPCRSM